MIREVEGDILLTKAQAIAHGVAPNDHFDQGLALALRERWPGMYKDFRHFINQQHPKEGTVWFWGGSEGMQLFNLFTQTGEHGGHPGPAKIENVNHALRELKKAIEKDGIKSIALPRLATGVGRLDWDEVKPVIEKHLGDLDCDVILYTTYHKGVEAAE